MNRQGGDVGTQYRSIILYHDDAQKEIAEKTIEELSARKKVKNPIVTRIESFKTFFKAEEYHRDYFKKNPQQTYCRLIIAPKLDKMRQHYLNKLKAKT